MKKSVAILLTIVLAVGILMSCTQNGTLLQGGSTELRNTNFYAITDEDEKQFLQGVQTFSENLCERVYKSDATLYEKNTALSPLSVYMALALAVECSQGNTREEILNVLGLSYEAVRAFTGDLYSASIRENKATLGTILKEDLTNSIWLQEGMTYSEECLKILAEEYFCSTYETDFAGDNDAANRKIRAFVKEKTNGLIDGNFDLDPTTVFALINTLYLKSLWNSDGNDLSETEEKYDFVCQDGTVKNINLLQGAFVSGRAITGQDYSAMYTSSRGCNLYFMVPNDGKTLQDVFTAENIASAVSASYAGDDELRRIHYYTRCLFPAYEADYSGEMSKILSDWGVKDLFDQNQCDFGAILPNEQAYCGKIIHKTKLKVDEKGIEGAAVTVMSNCGSAGPDGWTTKYEDFVVGKAFGYVICDNYGNILFAGTVAN